MQRQINVEMFESKCVCLYGKEYQGFGVYSFKTFAYNTVTEYLYEVPGI